MKKKGENYGFKLQLNLIANLLLLVFQVIIRKVVLDFQKNQQEADRFKKLAEERQFTDLEYLTQLFRNDNIF